MDLENVNSEVDSATDTSSETTLDSMFSEGSQDSSGLNVESAASEQPAYVPNLKFSVKGQEMEFDESFRGLVTSKEMEDKVREYHTRYHGLDEIKKSREAVEGQYNQYRQQVDPLVGHFQKANEAYLRNDIDQTLEALGMDANKVLEWANFKNRLNHLSPAAREEYNRMQQEQRSSYQAQQQAEYYRQQLMDRDRQSKISEIDQALSEPTVSSIQQSFDAKHGPNAFKRELIRRGKLYQAETGQNLPASQVASELVQFFSGYTPQPQVQQPQVAVPLKKDVPVLPAVQSSGSTQVKKSIKSIDDIFKVRESRNL